MYFAIKLKLTESPTEYFHSDVYTNCCDQGSHSISTDRLCHQAPLQLSAPIKSIISSVGSGVSVITGFITSPSHIMVTSTV
jgi:hypothetical protein